MAVALLVTLAGCVGGLGIEGVSDESDENGADSALEVDTGALEIRHLDVGQADATLVVTPDDETILIDSGDWRADGSGVIDALETQDIDRLDHLVATHGHADHIGGHAAIIEHLETEGEGVGAAYDSGVAHTSQTYDNYLDAIETHDVQLFEVQDGDDLPLEDETLAATVLNPPAGDSGDDLHSNSVTLVLEFGDFAYLTTGDAEADAEQRLVDDHGEALAADAYQAGHHGSSTSSTEPFLDAVEPEIAVISSALESQYGHPHDEVLEDFDDRDVDTYWTAVHGDITLTVEQTGNGTDVSVTTEHDASSDPAALLDRKHEATAEDDGSASLLEPRPQDALAAPGALVST
ncbi:ComEC/Rec2 family competence protein [Natronolimnobius baerhuensis]|uniref:ComEC/Rec2 family competence protein n=1 Tax=Natronolimnobius baerhuensis TaxID=253108 RepID=UPI000B404A08|nr:MBL fold metallo-hydrolase [Natronolimnobius baerhuensis]